MTNRPHADDMNDPVAAGIAADIDAGRCWACRREAGEPHAATCPEIAFDAPSPVEVGEDTDGLRVTACVGQLPSGCGPAEDAGAPRAHPVALLVYTYRGADAEALAAMMRAHHSNAEAQPGGGALVIRPGYVLPRGSDKARECWWASPLDHGAICSNIYTGHDCADAVRSYGGHLVCESVPARVRPMILAVPALLDAGRDLLRALNDAEAGRATPADVLAARLALSGAIEAAEEPGE